MLSLCVQRIILFHLSWPFPFLLGVVLEPMRWGGGEKAGSDFFCGLLWPCVNTCSSSLIPQNALGATERTQSQYASCVALKVALDLGDELLDKEPAM